MFPSANLLLFLAALCVLLLLRTIKWQVPTAVVIISKLNQRVAGASTCFRADRRHTFLEMTRLDAPPTRSKMHTGTYTHAESPHNQVIAQFISACAAGTPEQQYTRTRPRECGARRPHAEISR